MCTFKTRRKKKFCSQFISIIGFASIRKMHTKFFVGHRSPTVADPQPGNLYINLASNRPRGGCLSASYGRPFRAIPPLKPRSNITNNTCYREGEGVLCQQMVRLSDSSRWRKLQSGLILFAAHETKNWNNFHFCCPRGVNREARYHSAVMFSLNPSI